MFGDMAIYRDDLDEDVPLYLQPAGLPPSAQKCLECLGVEKAHWTKLAVHCTSCGNHSMSFSEYTAGKNIEKFKEYALKSSMSKPPELDYLDENGHTWYGAVSNFKAN